MWMKKIYYSYNRTLEILSLKRHECHCSGRLLIIQKKNNTLWLKNFAASSGREEFVSCVTFYQDVWGTFLLSLFLVLKIHDQNVTNFFQITRYQRAASIVSIFLKSTKVYQYQENHLLFSKEKHLLYLTMLVAFIRYLSCFINS